MQLYRTMGVGITALAIALAGAAEAQSADPTSGSGAEAGSSGQPGAKVCYSNLDGATGVAIVSQNFAPDDDAINSAAADDFTLDKKCRLKSVTAVGLYFIGGPADDQTVTVYKDKNGKPGRVKTEQTVAGSDDAGTFVMPLEKVKLKRGTYWLSVVANLDYAGGEGGEWGWETTTDAVGADALWENPGDGFATGCTVWTDMQSCIGGGRGGDDFLFALN